MKKIVEAVAEDEEAGRAAEHKRTPPPSIVLGREEVVDAGNCDKDDDEQEHGNCDR